MSCSFVENNLIPCPLGKLNLICCSNGLHSVEIFTNISKENEKLTSNLKEEEASSFQMIKSIHWLNSYFASQPEDAVLPPICPINSGEDSFTKKVWSTLVKEVPFGKSISYSDLATLVGKPGAARAIGTAMKKNPVPLFIPCHRVIKHNGHLGLYTGGIGVKKWLIDHELKLINNLS